MLDERQEFSSSSFLTDRFSNSTVTNQQTSGINSANLKSQQQGNSVISENSSDYQFTSTIVSQRTPVLFSTNRGLLLRVTKHLSRQNSRRQHGSCINDYDLKFCDLERWSTNRANTISLNDAIGSQTFTVHHSGNNLNNSNNFNINNTKIKQF